MNRKLFFHIIALPLLFFVVGCAPDCSIEEYSTFFPILESPSDGAVLDYNSHPTLDWTHQESCNPEYYIVHIERGDGKTGQSTVPGDTTTFTMENTLIPGMQYDWYIEPFGDFVGDGSGEVNVQYIYGNSSPVNTFFADGICSPSELEPPVLIKPENGSWVGDNWGSGSTQVEIRWKYPGDCYPDHYHYQLSANPSFTNIISSGITAWDDRSQWIAVPECARIYWRVEARTGNSSGGYSAPSRFTFMLDGTCWQNQTSIDAALLKGYVFEDYCKTTKPYIPEGVDIWPPCTFGEPYGVHADGNRNRVDVENEVTGLTDPAEIGIPGVVVDLGAGPCPSSGLDQFITVENGNYYFMVQSPGEYCVSIDKAKNPDLDHGIWTLPLTNQDIAEATIAFNPGDDLIFQNFGWDKNDFLRIDFSVDLTSFCRAGDSILHKKLAVVEQGTSIPLLRRNADATWFETFVDGIPCLISIESGEPEGNVMELEVFDPYPVPTETEPSEPEPSDRPSSTNCSSYTSEATCSAAGCKWTPPGLIPSKCVPK